MQVFITRALRAVLLAGGLLVAGAGAAHAADDGTLPSADAVVQVEAAPVGTAVLATSAGTPGADASGTLAELQALVTIGSFAPVAAPDGEGVSVVADAPTTGSAVVTVTTARVAGGAVAANVTADLAAAAGSGTALVALGAPGDSTAAVVRVGANRAGSAPETGSLLVAAGLGATGLGATGLGATGLGATEVVDQGSSARRFGLLSPLEAVGARQVGSVTTVGAAAPVATVGAAAPVGTTGSAGAMQVGAASSAASGRQLVSGASSALPSALAFTGAEPGAATLLALLLIAAGLKVRARAAAGALIR